jgi:outer membrane protein assembly factor BamA
MQTPAVALAVLLVVSSLSAQSPTSRPEVAISDLTLAGVTHLSSAELQDIAAEVKSYRYPPNQPNEIGERIHYALLERGYFDAKLDNLDVTRVRQVGSEATLSVSASVNEGQQYRLSEITFSGAQAFPDNQLRSLFAIANGDIFNTDKIREGLESLRKLYATQGYINFTPVPNTDADHATSLVSLKIDLDEGKQFRFGRFLFDGGDPQPGTSAELIELWKPYEGKLYDYRLVERYWQSIQTKLPPGLELEKTLVIKQDPKGRIVSVRIDLPNSK